MPRDKRLLRYAKISLWVAIVSQWAAFWIALEIKSPLLGLLAVGMSIIALVILVRVAAADGS